MANTYHHIGRCPLRKGQKLFYFDRKHDLLALVQVLRFSKSSRDLIWVRIIRVDSDPGSRLKTLEGGISLHRKWLFERFSSGR